MELAHIYFLNLCKESLDELEILVKSYVIKDRSKARFNELLTHAKEARGSFTQALDAVREAFLFLRPNPNFIPILKESFSCNLASFFLFSSLLLEREPKPVFFARKPPPPFHKQEKAELISYIIDGYGSKSGSLLLKLFFVRTLLMYAKYVPYESQCYAFITYFNIFPEFLGTDDLINVYDLWQDISPNLRGSLKEQIRTALKSVVARSIVTRKQGDILVENEKGVSIPPSKDSN